MSLERMVRLAQLPEMRLAYFETTMGELGGGGVGPAWDSFNRLLSVFSCLHLPHY